MVQNGPRNDVGWSTGGHDSLVTFAGSGLILDESERRIRGVTMPPLLTGELKLLRYLGEHSPTWRSSYQLSVSVYQREDAAGRQLVWKYASTLRRKLALSLPELIELCRRRGYRCRQHLVIAADERGAASSAQLLPR
jgi:DNA-binding response OmpR family regulator